MIILSGHWKLSVTERCPYWEVRLYAILLCCLLFLRYYNILLWYVNHGKQDRVNPVFMLMYRHEAFLSQKGK